MSAPHPDRDIVEAFTQWSAELWRGREPYDLPDFKTMEHSLWERSPSTAHGIALQLRVILHTIAGSDERWLESACLGAMPPRFDEMLGMGECTKASIWRIIQLLESMGEAQIGGAA